MDFSPNGKLHNAIVDYMGRLMAKVDPHMARLTVAPEIMPWGLVTVELDSPEKKLFTATAAPVICFRRLRRNYWGNPRRKCFARSASPKA